MGLVGLQKRIYAIIQVALLTETQKVRAYIVVQELWLAGSKWTLFTVASVSLVFVNTFFLFYSTLRRRQAANWNGTSSVCVYFFSVWSKEIQWTFFIFYFWCSSSQDSSRKFVLHSKEEDRLRLKRTEVDKRQKRLRSKRKTPPEEEVKGTKRRQFFRKAGGKTEMNNLWSLYFSTTDADASCQLISPMFIRVSSASHRGWVHWFAFLL